MSNPVVDFSVAVALSALAVVGSFVVMPRPKPEPPPPVTQPVCDPRALDKVCETEPVTTRKAPITDAERVQAIESDVKKIAGEQKELAEQLRALALARGQKDQ